MEPDEDKKEYFCPANPSHKLIGKNRLFKHLYNCKDMKGKLIFKCKYEWSHMFRDQTERDFHEEKLCEFKREGIERTQDYMQVAADKEYEGTLKQKLENRARSKVYYNNNRDYLAYEKEVKKKVREIREKEELQRQEELKREQDKIQEIQKFYADKSYVDQNTYVVNTVKGTIFALLVKSGHRKLHLRTLDIKETLELKDRLRDLSELEYMRMLGGEFIAHPSSIEPFSQLYTQLDLGIVYEGSDRCYETDELVILASNRIVHYVREERIAILIVRYSKFINNQRSFFLPENSRSSYFYNDPNISYVKTDFPLEKKEPLVNALDPYLVIALEHKEKIKNLIKQIVDHRLNKQRIEKLSNEETRNAQNELEKLNRERLRIREKENEISKRLDIYNEELERYKKQLTHRFTKEVHHKEDELNEKINRFHRSEIISELEWIEQEKLILDEEENKITRRVKDAESLEVVETHLKKKRMKEFELQKLQQLIEMKKRNCELTTNNVMNNIIESMCHICQSNGIRILYLPCGHFFVCEKCKDAASSQGIFGCLHCKQSVTKIIKVRFN